MLEAMEGMYDATDNLCNTVKCIFSYFVIFPRLVLFEHNVKKCVSNISVQNE